MRINKRQYRNGDRRTIKKFAWFPLRVDNNTIIWLEWYWSDEVYFSGWDGGEWENEKIRLINPVNNIDKISLFIIIVCTMITLLCLF